MQLHEHDVAYQAFRKPGVLTQRERDVLEHVEVGEQRAVLKQHAHAPAQRVQRAPVEGADVAAVDDHLPGVGEYLSRHEPQQRRLARTARAHDRRHLAAPDGDVEPAEDRFAVDGVVDAAKAGHGIVARTGRLRRRGVRRARHFGRARTQAASSEAVYLPRWASPFRRARCRNAFCPAPRFSARPPQALSALSCSARP